DYYCQVYDNSDYYIF
nr:immunoglobulin light chain junction region [Macaca mulatta]MOY05748.1 immunoglobulin light chain junction region [Macaca mulatta]MOY06012.1 immunoglobulin light chain junction region [Macaca mulatta]MOY09445.1 immunoglobulin light chain junction region [Macaca mulatta]